MRDPSYPGASGDCADATHHSGPAAASHAGPRANAADAVNMLLTLTFGEEIAKDLIGALATGLFVAVGGGVAAAILTRRWEARRENFELRTKLVEQVSRTAQRMYVACQHTSRVRRNRRDPAPGIAAVAALDEKYFEFSTESLALEAILGARYGVSWWPPGKPTEPETREPSEEETEHEAGEPTGTPADDETKEPPAQSTQGESMEARDETSEDDIEEPLEEPAQSDAKEVTDSDVFCRWHQIRDLLTAYYFNLKGQFPGDALKRNSKGYDNRFHSGVDLKAFVADKSKRPKPTPDELKKMRDTIRREFEKALARLVNAMVTEKIKTR
jgi:hypothetical protein